MHAYAGKFGILDARGGFLAGQAANETSQFGEDGLIAAALERFGISNQWCFEVGAADVVYVSNTYRLRQAGWNAVLIESDRQQFETLARHATPSVRVVNERVGVHSLDTILEDCGAPNNLDLGVIDIDGQDYWVWSGMTRYRPRLMLVEFDNHSEDEPAFIPAVNGEGQASFRAIEQLGRDKGYVPLCNTQVNMLFAASEVVV